MFVLGIDTDCCVLKTAVDLFENHIHPIVLAHYLHRMRGQVSHDAGVKVLELILQSKDGQTIEITLLDAKVVEMGEGVTYVYGKNYDVFASSASDNQTYK
jgi:hypothetical protein